LVECDVGPVFASSLEQPHDLPTVQNTVAPMGDETMIKKPFGNRLIFVKIKKSVSIGKPVRISFIGFLKTVS
jgi:hypothetical protein